MHFSIISVGWNAFQYLEAWYTSISSQSYKDWKCYVVLDPSDQKTEKLLHKLTDNDPRFVVRYNSKRQCCLHNTYDAIQLVTDPESVCATMDMDDAFYHNHALQIVADQYSPEVWLTFGKWIASDHRVNPFCNPIPDWAWDKNAHRQGPWCTSQLRTFKKWLFDKINVNDFQLSPGNWYSRATDRAFMYPMLEMCGRHNVRRIDEPIYWYNVGVCGANHPQHKTEVVCLQHIQRKPAYARLPNASN